MEAVCRELRDLVVELDLVEGGRGPAARRGRVGPPRSDVADTDNPDADTDAPARAAIG